MHSPNRALAAVPTRHDPHCSYGRYSALVPQLSQSSTPPHSRAQTPFYTRTPVCHETHTPRHYIHTGRRGCMFAHAHRHLPHTQRPHTRCLSHTWSLTHSCRFPRTHHTAHTRGGTHPWCFTYTHRLFTHTRGAGKHAPRHTRDHTARTRGLFQTRGFFRTRGRSHTRPCTPAMRALQHAF